MNIAKIRAFMILREALIDIRLIRYSLGGARMFVGDAEPDNEKVIFRTSEQGKVYAIDPEKGEIKGGLGPVKGKLSPGASSESTSSSGAGSSISSGGSSGSGGKKGSDPTIATGKGRKMQEKYGGKANFEGVGNDSRGHKPVYKNGTGKTKVKMSDFDEGSVHTLLDHLDENGVLTPEREALHNEIVNKHFEAVAKPDGQPTFYMMGGGPAAGKSSVLKNHQVSVPDKFNAVEINADTIKDELPEYAERLKTRDKSAAAYAHEESSALAKRVQATAFENGYDTVLDGTGDNTVESVASKIEAARKAGYRVEGCYVTCPTEEAIKRSHARYERSGRFVPDKIVRKTHKGVSQILPQVAHLFDKVELYDTSSGGTPVLIAKGGNGKPLEVLDQRLYDLFIGKASEDVD